MGGINPMNMIFQMIKGGGNPQQIIQQIMGNSQVMENPILKNTLEMAQRGDSKGIEELARNLCKEKGVNPDDAIGKIKSQFGLS